jgi:glycosyltransferase A (GT-A) superfamily protein (DUF2064 family)
MLDHLLIFARHPVLGQGKTRLASTIGPVAALDVYRELLAHTRAAADGVGALKNLWLAGEMPLSGTPFSEWAGYEQHQQPAGDLGQRMHQAFATAFVAGAMKVVVIGTDCPRPLTWQKPFSCLPPTRWWWARPWTAATTYSACALW